MSGEGRESLLSRPYRLGEVRPFAVGAEPPGRGIKLQFKTNLGIRYLFEFLSIMSERFVGFIAA